MTAVREGPSRGSRPLLELGLGAAWLLGVAAVLQILERVLPAVSVGVAILGALLVDYCAGRSGVRWTTVEGESPLAARRVAGGAAVALAVGLGVILVARAAGWLAGHGEGVHASSAIGFAVLRAAAVATRDELLYRGIPLAAAARAGVRPSVARAFAALVGGAAIALVPGSSPAAVALAVAGGWLSASLWARDRGAWGAVGAAAAWQVLFGSVLHGGLFDVDWMVGNLAIGVGSWGPPAWLATAALAAAGVGVTRMAARRL
jgi:hypothetical protein